MPRHDDKQVRKTKQRHKTRKPVSNYVPRCWNMHMEATIDENDVPRIENCARKQGVVSFKTLDAGAPSVLCKTLAYSASNTEDINLQKACIFWKTGISILHESYG